MYIQELLHLKNSFLLNHQFLYWSPESILKVSGRSQTLGPLEDLARTWLALITSFFANDFPNVPADNVPNNI